jgi:hypothetical protein
MFMIDGMHSQGEILFFLLFKKKKALMRFGEMSSSFRKYKNEKNIKMKYLRRNFKPNERKKGGKLCMILIFKHLLRLSLLSLLPRMNLLQQNGILLG